MNANVVENDENGCALDVQPCMPCLCMPCLIFAILHTSQIVQSSFALKCIERQCLAISHSKATVNADETENATLGHFWNCACPIRATHTSTSMIPQNISKHVQSRKTSFLKNPKSGHCCESAIQLVVFPTQSLCLSEGTVAHLHKHEALWPIVIESISKLNCLHDFRLFARMGINLPTSLRITIGEMPAPLDNMQQFETRYSRQCFSEYI